MTVKDFMEYKKVDYDKLHIMNPILHQFFTIWKRGDLHLDTDKQFTDFMGFIYHAGRDDLAIDYDLAVKNGEIKGEL